MVSAPAPWQLTLARIEGALPFISPELSECLALASLRRLWRVHVRDYPFDNLGIEHNPGLEADELMRSWYSEERRQFLSWISRRGHPPLAHAAKLAMADRDAYLTDPTFRDVPVARLLDPAYHAELATRIDPARAVIPPAATNPIGGGTIYLAVVDADGNAVSLIESNYLGFGSGVVDPDTGVHYQDRGSYFSLDPAHPNVLEPGKRTLHTLLPGMLFRDGAGGQGGSSPWIVAGSMGGDAQPQIHAQFVSAVVDGGVDVRTAVAAPRWFIEPADHFAPPTAVHLEPRHALGIAEHLTALGHDLAPTVAFDGNLGHEHAIELVAGGPAQPDGSLAAATDPRSAGVPAVW